MICRPRTAASVGGAIALFALTFALAFAFAAGTSQRALAAPPPGAPAPGLNSGAPWAPLPPPFRGAPQGQLPFVQVGAELGLQELSPWHVAQDSVGYLWISSDQGVYRYDGRHVQHFGLAEGLPSLYTTALAIGRGDRIWCVTQRGLALYQGERWHSTWEQYPGLGLENAGENLGVDARGLLWVSTKRGLLHEREEGGFELDPAWSGGDVHSLFVSPTGAMVVGSLGEIAERATDGPFRRMGAEDGVPPERIVAVLRDAAGRLWASSTSGVVVRRPGAKRFERWGAFESNWPRLSLDRAGQPWFTSEVGLFHLDDREEPRRAERLPTRRVVGAFHDREGSLWFTGHGLSRLAGGGLWSVYFEPEGLPDDAIWSVRRAPDGRLWVGTQRGLAYGTPSGLVKVPEVPAEQLRGITPGPAGELWLNGPEARVYRYDPQRRTVEAFGAEQGLPMARTLALLLDPADGAVWVGTDAGLLRGADAGAGLRFSAAELGVEGGVGRVRDLVFDRQGRIWIGSERGLFVREAAGRGFRRLTTAEGLRMDNTSFLVARASGEICAAYTLDRGLSCFRYEGGVLSPMTHYDVSAGLGSDIIYFLGEDASQRLWVGTNAGADMLEGGHIEHFGVLDGLPNHDCDSRSFWADEGGDVWVGTSGGLGRFAGALYGGPPAPPQTTLSAWREGVDGSMRPLAAGEQLPYALRAVEFQFSALSFLHGSEMQFQIRLVGEGEGEGEREGEREGAGWGRAHNDRMRYVALEARHYQFQVRARHPGGAWGLPQALRFVVRPPWWQRAWFYVSIVGALLAGFGLIVRWRSATLARRNRELERLVAERTRELTAAQTEIARSEKLSALGRVLAQLSHELNNPINVVWNNVDPLREYFGTMVNALAAYREGCRALPDRGEALERRWREAELDYVTQDAAAALSVIATAAARVRNVQTDLSAFLRGDAAEKQRRDLNEDLRETLAMIERSAPRGVHLVAVYGALPPIAYEPGRMNQVFLNLLQNAVDAVGQVGTIAVRTWAEGGEVKIEVADDGPGIPAAIRERIFEPFFTTKAIGKGTGLGLSICRQVVVEHHGGSLAIAPGPASGVSFVITLPALAAEAGG
jgi:signal transduction histidine kinase/ligand-binding sensor domain-containing protein